MSSIIIQILFVSLGILLILVLYKYLIRRFSKGRIIHSHYCTLYSLEQNINSGILEFYFICPIDIELEFYIIDTQGKAVYSQHKLYNKGGNIIRYDSTQLLNGDYLYGIKTFEQETIKKMIIKN